MIRSTLGSPYLGKLPVPDLEQLEGICKTGMQGLLLGEADVCAAFFAQLCSIDAALLSELSGTEHTNSAVHVLGKDQCPHASSYL